MQDMKCFAPFLKESSMRINDDNGDDGGDDNKCDNLNTENSSRFNL